MKTRTSLVVLGLLALVTSCGSLSDLNSDQLNNLGVAKAATDDAASASLNDGSKAAGSKDPDVSFLSEAAQAALAQAKTLHGGIRSQVDAICAPDQTLRETIKTAIDAIRRDASKSEQDKRTAIEAVRAQYKEQLTADRTRMETCNTENEAALAVWKDLGKALHEACMLPRPEGGKGGAAGANRGPGHGPGGQRSDGQGSGHGQGRHAPLTDDQKQEFETKLTSATCTQALADTQAKLP